MAARPPRIGRVMLAETANAVACQHVLQCEGAAIDANVAEPGLAVVETKVVGAETACTLEAALADDRTQRTPSREHGTHAQLGVPHLPCMQEPAMLSTLQAGSCFLVS
ncbi:hypothetical protein [Streptomyces mirabilis]|uniref:hypothetical protein n=1 Tax=Streptomyces mirabilis TaxID=68239 RepID=UPI00339FDF15